MYTYIYNIYVHKTITQQILNQHNKPCLFAIKSPQPSTICCEHPPHGALEHMKSMKFREEPSINVGQGMDFFHTHAFLKSFGNGPHSHLAKSIGDFLEDPNRNKKKHKCCSFHPKRVDANESHR